jgi:2'-5' RNA ligase
VNEPAATPTPAGATERLFIAPPFRVEAFDLYASDLRPSGAVHTRQQRFPLAN